MTRAVLLNISVREQWPLAGLIDRAASHWIQAHPLDGGDDEDTDTGTDTTAPDNDNDDIASFTSQQTTAAHRLHRVQPAFLPHLQTHDFDVLQSRKGQSRNRSSMSLGSMALIATVFTLSATTSENFDSCSTSVC